MALEKAKIIQSTNTIILAWLGEVYAKAGMREKAREVIDNLETLSKRRYVSALDFALVHAGLNQYEEAFRWLERAQQERSPLLAILLPVDPRFDNLRPDARFHDIMDRILARVKS